MTLARGTDRIESERLILRRIAENDLEFLVRLNADPDVALYLGPARPRSSEETSTWLRSTLWSYDNLALGGHPRDRYVWPMACQRIEQI
jgi:RimJ/RimL family protein N-acetyltransferase